MTEIILTSSVLILLLVILRRALRGRISPCVQYALWLLVAARLLIPGTLFEAPVSMMGAVEELREPTQWSAAVVSTPSASIQAPSSDGPAANFVTLPQEPADVPAKTFTTTPSEPRNAEDILRFIWRAGIAVTVGTLVLSNLIFYLRLRKNRKRLTLPDTPWSGELPVYEMEGLASPCLFGLFRPAIYLNETAMDAEHPEHILAHEYAHYRHGDHVWAILRSVCLAIHWYNPLVWWAAALSRRDCELACDASALRQLGEDARIDYGQTLLGMVSRSRNPAALLHTATTMTAGKKAMKERIALIIKQPRMRKITLAVVVLLACLLAACSFGRAAELPVEPADIQDMPVAVAVGQSASSNLNDFSSITDPEEVKRLWELYQSFEYEGAYDPTGMGGWFVSVSFEFGDGPSDDTDIFFILSQHGIHTQDGEDLLLKNIDEIYAEFLRMSTSSPVQHLSTSNTEEALANNAKAIIEMVQQGKDVSEWLPLMNYMDWGFLRQAAVEAGMDDGDGSAAAVGIISAINRYIDRQGGSMTMAEYLYILTATAGLDGAVTEGYAYMIHRIYIMNPSQFAYVALEQLPEEQRDTVVDLFCSEWYYDWVSSSDMPTREEAIAQLEADLAAYIFANPSEMTLHSAGSTFQFQIFNVPGIYALSYESSDPSVASVDPDGIVTANSPGEAVITAHLEGGGGIRDFICAVSCEWETGESGFRVREDGSMVKEDGSEVIFTAYQQGWQFYRSEWERGSTVTFSSSDLAVATVDPEGLVYSEGPGEAVITAHYLDSNGPREYTCLVRSDWDDTATLGIDDANYRLHKETFELYGDEIAAWQKRYEDFVANTPSAPARAITYKDPSEIESLAASYLQDYYDDYFNAFFAQDPFTSDKENIGDVFVNITKFDMNVEATVDYSLRIVPAFFLPNGDLLNSVIQAKYGLTTTLTVDRELHTGPPMPLNASYTCALTPGTASGEDNWTLEYIRRDIQARTESRMQSDSDLSQWSITSVEFTAGHGSMPEDIAPGDTVEVQYDLHVTYNGASGYNTIIGPLSVIYTFSE